MPILLYIAIRVPEESLKPWAHLDSWDCLPRRGCLEDHQRRHQDGVVIAQQTLVGAFLPGLDAAGKEDERSESMFVWN